ncbi:MAG: DUF1549 domain-containing protein [Planctomycetia bacterium]|nr:DUF1549 domain-containing protein [Planctomycetia bacterium]
MRALILMIAILSLLPARGSELLPKDKPIQQIVDHYIDELIKDQGAKVAPQADDATILRRLTLDLNGRIPTVAEWKEYVESKDPLKKEKLVDRLMSSPAFTRHQLEEFETMLAQPASGGRRGPGGSREYIARVFKENRSWDRIFRDLLLADEKEKGSSDFLKARIKDQDRLTNDVSVVFFGVNISCAQCHDHPLVHDWKQEHYYGLKSFLARTFEQGAFLGEKDTGVVSYKTTKNENKTARMMFLTGKVIEAPGMVPDNETKKGGKAGKKNDKDKSSPPPPAPKFSARAALADVALQSDQRQFFAKNIVNRTWHRFFGRGLVTPLDQMHSENAPSHPELLDWLARDTAENSYDLRRLTRGLVLSRAYSRASSFEGDRQPDAHLFAVARIRAMTPMQIATSLRLATTAPDQFSATLKADELDKRIEGYESASRGFASLLEQPRDDFQISVTEALMFSNNDRIQKEFLIDAKDRLIGAAQAFKDLDQAADLLLKNVLVRTPTADEKKAVVEYLSARKDRPLEALRQVVWALLTSAEFRFNY